MGYENEKKGENYDLDNTPPVESTFADHIHGHQFATNEHDVGIIVGDENKLHKNLQGRHMQMIAIGGAIGAGLFLNTGSALATGGPASLFLGFLIVGIVIYLMMQALAELAVIYPINGAFTMYICRFVDPSWGFACGWEYGIGWLTTLPFEISAACNIIHFWTDVSNVNNTAWIVPLLFAIVAIQFFGVRGYGEVEFVLSIMKIAACIGFILFAIIVDCGGVPGDDRGYIGARYWHLHENGVINGLPTGTNATTAANANGYGSNGGFLNGFHGFCSVFVTASFAYGGTELVGLAAAETPNPKKEVPKATKQVVVRIAFFYLLNLFLLGLIIPATSPLLLDNQGDDDRPSPFVAAIKLAGVQALPSVFNAVILISVMSVANSCTFASTRTFQALSEHGMGPKLFAYIDKKGRPVSVIVLQILFGCLAFINLDTSGGGNIFNWLLSLSGLSSFFIFGSIAVAHIRFRSAWKLQGHSIEELPFKAAFGIWGSYVCAIMNFVFLAAQFYVALWPVGGPNLNPTVFFQDYLAAPFLLGLYVIWKVYSFIYVPKDRPLYVKIKDIDIYQGMREDQLDISGPDVSPERREALIQEIRDAHNAEKKTGILGYGQKFIGAFI